MSESENVVSILKAKVNKLMGIYIEEKEKNEELGKKLQSLENELNNKKEEIEQLNTKYNTLKLAKNIASVADNKQEAKTKINQIVREIDKCIALLNR